MAYLGEETGHHRKITLTLNQTLGRCFNASRTILPHGWKPRISKPKIYCIKLMRISENLYELVSFTFIYDISWLIWRRQNQ